jgi:hypothetical protein
MDMCHARSIVYILCIAILISNLCQNLDLSRGHQDMSQLYREYLPSSTTTHTGDPTSFSAGINQLLQYLDKPERPSNSTWKPPCQILLDNHHFTYHYFLLESIVAEYPIPALDSCNHARMEFTIIIMKGVNSFQRQRGLSWKKYAETDIINRVYKDEESRERIVIDIYGAKYAPDEPFHYVINATCRCSNSTQWLSESSNGYCVFHEEYPQFADSVQAAWLSPMHKRFFFPNRLPAFHHTRNWTKAVNLCVIGSPRRRHCVLVANYLSTHPKLNNESLRIHNLGWGQVPAVLEPYQRFVSSIR